MKQKIWTMCFVCVQGESHWKNRPEGHEVWVQILSLLVTEHPNRTAYFMSLSAPSVKWDISGRLSPVTFLFYGKRYRSHKWQLLDVTPKWSNLQSAFCHLQTSANWGKTSGCLYALVIKKSALKSWSITWWNDGNQLSSLYKPVFIK